MDDNKTIQTFEKLLGQSIVNIKYIETKFHYSLSGNWTNVDPDLFVLHSPEWEITFSNGQKWFLTNPQPPYDPAKQPIKSIVVNSSSIANSDDKIHIAPRTFGWKNIFEKEITIIKFYKRVTQTKKYFGLEISKTYQDNIQIIQFFFKDTSFSITTMDGDIGRMTFYPTGYLGERLGFFFDKTVAESHTVYGDTMRMEMIYQTNLKK
ncbi:MAG: hypothetical protein A3F72_14955 [Bacteroidetes bacterium RIFCSPLOWO2_12_FULL_35_15]|nr:MAG: hypothetical protein A3F72_14955 [Bacteroidetes bacterium RIFCSPLOWO2_12_FULL_35_15]